MNRKAKKRALRIRLTVIYSAMAFAVLLLATGLYFVIQGYRFNKYDGKIEQGGLVQFNSTPTGVDVWLDQSRLANKTQSKLTVGAGSHTVAMQKDGYNTWKKDVMVRAGEILWLDYVRLVPKTLSVEAMVPLTGASSGKASYDAKNYAIIETPSEPVVSVINLDSATPSKRQLALPAGTYTLPQEGESQAYEVYSWAYDNRYVLIKHSYGTHTEWISFNTSDGKVAKNITKAVGIDAGDVQYSKDDTNTVLMLTTASEVRRVNVDQGTVTGPLLSNVNEFTMYDSATIVYTTNQDPTTHVRKAGYFTMGTAGPRVVYQTPAGDGTSLHFGINKFYGKTYEVVAYGSAITIYTGDLSASDAKDPAPFALLATLNMTMSDNVNYIGFSPDQHRFVYAVGGNRVLTYDLDLNVHSEITLQSASGTQLDWVDDFHFVTNEGSTLRLYDYDGTNGHDMLKNAAPIDASLLQNGKYLNAVTKNGDKVDVVRIKMIIE